MWSWLNKDGNREFYMNCGPATIQASTQSVNRRQRRAVAPPPLFVANIDSVNDCVAPAGYDYRYPDPGQDVDVLGTGPYTDLKCSQETSLNGTMTWTTVDKLFTSMLSVGHTIVPTTSSWVTVTRLLFTSTSTRIIPGSTSDPSLMPYNMSAAAALDPQPMPGQPCHTDDLWVCARDGKMFQRCASG